MLTSDPIPRIIEVTMVSIYDDREAASIEFLVNIRGPIETLKNVPGEVLEVRRRQSCFAMVIGRYRSTSSNS